MKKSSKFIRFYLFLAIVIGIWGLIDAYLTNKGFTSNTYSYLLSGVIITFFFFNIIVIAIFKRQKQPGISYVLPIYYLITYPLTFGASVILIFTNTNANWVPMTLITVTLVSSLFEIGYSLFLIKKLKIFNLTAGSANFRTQNLEPPKSL